MEINRNNYEIFIIDYLEGILEPGQVDDLLVFLEENPDLKNELGLMEDFCLHADTGIILPNKDNLKKHSIISIGPINETNYEEYMISCLEGEIRSTEDLLLNRFLARNPEKQKDLEILKKTYLKPDIAIIYKDKQKLKKTTLLLFLSRPSLLFPVSVAAMILLALMIFNPFRKINESFEEFAEISVKTEIPLPEGHTKIQETSIASQPEEMVKAVPSEIKVIKPGRESKVFAKNDGVPRDAGSNNLETRDVTESLPPSRLRPITMPGDHESLSVISNPETPVLADKSDNNAILKNIGVINPPYHRGQGTSNTAISFLYQNAKKIFQKKGKTEREKRDFSFWTLLDLGLYGVTQLTGKEVVLERVTNEQGDVVAFALSGEDFEISKSRRGKTEPAKKNFE